MSRASWIAAIALLAGCTSGEPQDPRTAQFDALPDWTGIWRSDLPLVGIDGFPFIDLEPAGGPPKPDTPLTIVNFEAPYKPEVRAQVQALVASTNGDLAREPQGAGGWGYPLMMYSPPPLQFSITPEETLIFNAYRDMRRIYTDGRDRPPPEDRWPPTTWGDSIGHWEGDTLVIETIDVREPRRYFGVNLPLTAGARYTERLRKVGPDRIEGEIVIDDPAVFSEPWTVKLAYVRETTIDRMVLDAFDGNRTGFDGEFNTIEPPAQAAARLGQ